LEGIAYSIRHIFDVLGDCGIHFSEVRASGGGTKDRLWLQTVSDVTGRQQLVPTVATGAEVGSTYLAATGLHVIQGMHEINHKVARGASLIQANMDSNKTYDRYYRIYRGLYAKTREDMHALAGLFAGAGPLVDRSSL
jgi:xylulokinase